MPHFFTHFRPFTHGLHFTPVVRRPLQACFIACLLLAGTGCHSLVFDPPGSSSPPANDPPAGGLKKPAAAVAASQSGAVAATPSDRTVLGRSQWIQAVPPCEGDKAASPYHCATRDWRTSCRVRRRNGSICDRCWPTRTQSWPPMPPSLWPAWAIPAGPSGWRQPLGCPSSGSRCVVRPSRPWAFCRGQNRSNCSAN